MLHRHSQMCPPFTSSQATSTTAVWDSAGDWGSTMVVSKVSARVSTIHRESCSKAQVEPILTFLRVSNCVWYPQETALSQETSCTHSWVWMAVVHVLAISHTDMSHVFHMSSNGMERKYLYYFKFSMGLENGGLNHKLKGSVAVFSKKPSPKSTLFQSLRLGQKLLTA